MIRFVVKPNLPEGEVKTIICGELSDELNEYFDMLGIGRIVIRSNNHIDYAVRNHADMAAIHLGINKILIDKQQSEIGEILKNCGFVVNYTKREIKGEYPKDIALNFTILGNKIIGKTDCADENLLKSADTFEKIDVRQGYCKCSCLVVDDNAVITDDECIFKTMHSIGVDCLFVSKGDVSLPGHEYGFIGGASGKISASEVLFFGDVTKHRDYKKIADFIENHGCKLISLSFPLTDFGGIIPLSEEV